jgi:hypothetical protein
MLEHSFGLIVPEDACCAFKMTDIGVAMADIWGVFAARIMWEVQTYIYCCRVFILKIEHYAEGCMPHSLLSAHQVSA